ncbi:MAG: T9SS type A sorting domain-containing protein, partial [Bacteroidia bacterium]|nr:T9SS type A sorting domain-containing protein [Bacteroidia bacterium]
SVLYSFDGTTWATLPGTYSGQTTTQAVTGLDLSVVDGQQFYIGFGWDNDSAFSGYPGFIIDDVLIEGTSIPACITPAQPTVLNLTATGDTVSGTFTASVNADNYLVVVNTTGVAPTPINGTNYNIGDTIGAGNVVADIDTNTTFTATGLLPSTLYYVFIYSIDNQCLGGPQYNTVNPLTGNISTTNSVYCTPSNELVIYNTTVKYINDVEFLGTLNDVSNLNSGNSVAGYTDWTGLTNSVQAQGEGINVYVGGVNGRGRWKAWVDWNKDDAFDFTTEEVYDSGAIGTTTTTFGFVIPPNQPIGDYRLRIRFHNTATDNWSYDFDACEFFDFWDDTTGNPNDGDFRLGEAEDYLFTIVARCPAQITSVTNGSTCGPGPATLNVSGTAGVTQFLWYTSETGGTPVATTPTGQWSPNVSATTTYWVSATDGSCESQVRTKVIATMNPVTTLTFNQATPAVCGEDDILNLSATGDTEVAYLINEDFESGGTGVFSVINLIDNGAATNALSEWQNRASTFVPSELVWFPAISSGFGGNQFVMATSDVNPSSGFVYTSLESPVLDSSVFTDLTLSFDMYFSKYLTGLDPDEINIFVSTDGGANWVIEQTYIDDVGYGTDFANLTLDLSAYINEPNLVISFDYYSIWADGVALDNIQLYGSRPLNPSFTWTGTVDAFVDAGATIPYNPGDIAPEVWIKPTAAQLALPSFSFTANATLSNGCVVSKDVTILNNTKIWTGNNDSNWENPGNWSPNGVPTANNCVIVRDVGTNPDPLTGPPVPPIPKFAYNLLVGAAGVLEIGADRSLTVTDAVTVEPGGVLYVKNNGSLVQINDVANSGDILVERAPGNGAAVNNLNYVYWSSPVTGFNVDDLSPDAAAGQKWEWQTTTANTYGNWVDASNAVMPAGKGFIVRGLSGVVPNPIFTLTPNSTLFSGVPHNGSISIPIYHGNYNVGGDPGYPGGSPGVLAFNSDDNWNLVGNPFPSAISADAFIDANAAIIEDNPASGSIIGAVWVWPHAGLPSALNNDPFYDNYVANYADQYIKHNKTGTTVPGGPADVYLASGQSFFVLADHAADPGGADSVIFNNSMRDATYSNNNFYEAPQSDNPVIGESEESPDKNRIWLNLSGSANMAKTILLGYINGATNEKDRMYDAPEFNGSSHAFYSLIGNEKYAIQGKALPFDRDDTIALGMILPSNDLYTISINTVDGLFESADQNIFLRDNYENTIHDLRLNPYSFMSDTGTYNDRFDIVYIQETLGNGDLDLEHVVVYVNNEASQLILKNPGMLEIDQIILYDAAGKVIFDRSNVEISAEYNFSTKMLSSGIYVAAVNFKDQSNIFKKVVVKN